MILLKNIYIEGSGEALVIEFLEPKIVINKFSYALDIDIEGQEFNVDLPIGSRYIIPHSHTHTHSHTHSHT